MKKLMACFLFVLIPRFIWGNIYGSISGKVIAEDTKKGLKGVIVELTAQKQLSTNCSTPKSVISDGEGSFLFADLEEDIYYLSCRPNPPYYGQGDPYPNHFDKALKLEVRKGIAIRDIVLTVRIGGAISGKIMDVDGKGIAGASVILRCEDLFNTKSDDNGNYRIGGINPSGEKELEVIVPFGINTVVLTNYISFFNRDIKVESGLETKGIDFVFNLQEPTGIEGYVKSMDDKPIEKVHIGIHVLDNKKIEIARGSLETDSDGHYLITGLPAGLYDVYAVKTNIQGDERKNDIKNLKIIVTKGEIGRLDFFFEQSIDNFLAGSPLLNSTKARVQASSANSSPTGVPIVIPGGSSNCDSNQIEDAQRLLENSYWNAAGKGSSGCSGWSNKTRQALANGVSNTTRIFFYCPSSGAGSSRAPSGDSIQVQFDPMHTCENDNTVMHELFHKGGEHNEKKVEACTNMCFPPGCQNHFYGSKPEDCCDEGSSGGAARASSSNASVAAAAGGESDDSCKPEPGNDTPDDSFSYATNDIAVSYPSEYPDILVYKLGYYKECGALLNKLGLRYSLIEADQRPEEMTDVPPLVILAEGALFGREGDKLLKVNLAHFTESGGNLIIMSQQFGSHIDNVVPVPQGAALKSYGFREDQSCFNGSLYFKDRHPVMSSLTNEKVNGTVDGYFSAYPASSTILLKRTSNLEPALLYYPYGQGTVILTSLYTDYANAHSQASSEELRLVRDLITFARNPNLPIPMFDVAATPNPNISMQVKVKNGSETNAAKAKILVKSADWKTVLFSMESAVTLAKDAEAEIAVSFTLPAIAPAQYGICHS